MLGFFKLGLNNIYFYCFGQYSPCFRIQCSGERCTVVLQMVFTSLKNDNGMLGFLTKRGHNCILY